MIDPSIFVSTELDYRINRNSRTTRVRKGSSRNRFGRSRNLFVRRSAERPAQTGLDG